MCKETLMKSAAGRRANEIGDAFDDQLRGFTLTPEYQLVLRNICLACRATDDEQRIIAEALDGIFYRPRRES